MKSKIFTGVALSTILLTYAALGTEGEHPTAPVFRLAADSPECEERHVFIDRRNGGTFGIADSEGGSETFTVCLIDGEYKKNGPAEQRYANGQIAAKANFVKGEIDGTLDTWYDNGKKKASAKFTMGKQTELTTWFMKGILRSRLILKEDGTMTLEAYNWSGKQEIDAAKTKEGLHLEYLADGEVHSPDTKALEATISPDGVPTGKLLWATTDCYLKGEFKDGVATVTESNPELTVTESRICCGEVREENCLRYSLAEYVKYKIPELINEFADWNFISFL